MQSKTILYLFVAGLTVYGIGLLLPNWLTYLLTIAIAKGLVVLGLVLLLRAG